MSEVTCEVMDSYSHIDQALEKEWDELVIATRGSIYLTCAWSRIWWEFYGKEKALRIFVYRCKDKLVGVMPVYIDKVGIGLLQTRLARLVGANNPPRIFDIPIIKEYAGAIGEHMAKHLAGHDRCDLISIGPVSDECEAKEVLFAAFKKMTAELGIARNAPFGVCTYFDLPNTYDAYMQSLSKNERRNRHEKLLKKEHDVHTVVIRDPHQIAAEMPQFSALHAAQWLPKGKLGSLGAWPAADAFNHRLAVELSRLGRTNLIKIMAGQTPIIYEYYYTLGNCGYWQISARVWGKEWDRFSLTTIGAIVMIRSMIEEGIKRIEGGWSHYDYKTRLGAKDSGISFLRLAANRPSSIAKYHLWVALQKLFTNFYYKLWYQRIQPQLPSVFHRPICLFHIRSIF